MEREEPVRPLASAVRESVVSSSLGLCAGGLFLVVVALGDRPAHNVLRLLAAAAGWCALFGAFVYVLERRALARATEPPTPAREATSVTLWRCTLQAGIWIVALVLLTLAGGDAALTGGIALGNGLLSALIAWWWRRVERRKQVVLLREPRVAWGSTDILFAAPKSAVEIVA